MDAHIMPILCPLDVCRDVCRPLCPLSSPGITPLECVSSHLLGHLVGVMQRVLALQEHPLLLGAGQPTGEPGAQGAAADAQAGERHGRDVQRGHRARPLHRPHELEVQDAADQPADAAGREQDHLRRKMFF